MRMGRAGEHACRSRRCTIPAGGLWLFHGSGPPRLSAGVDDLLERHDASTIRDLLLRHHYREDWEFDEGALTRGVEPQDGPATRQAFFEALDEDAGEDAAQGQAQGDDRNRPQDQARS